MKRHDDMFQVGFGSGGFSFRLGGVPGMWRKGQRLTMALDGLASELEVTGVTEIDDGWRQEDVYGNVWPHSYEISGRIVHLPGGVHQRAGGPSDQGRVGGDEDRPPPVG